MWKCHKCGKPVYFAERKQSLGYDWHPECLRCEECGKRLNPGQHAEHKGVPYCHVPCYGALFGPQLFGHGTRVESHTSFGQKGSAPRIAGFNGPPMPRSHLETKLKLFNQFYDGRSGEIRSREVNGRLVLEGALRIYWGVQGVIHLKEDDDQRTVVTVRKRNSCRLHQSVDLELVDLSGNEVPCTNVDTISTNSEAPSSDQMITPKNLSLTLPPKLDVRRIGWDELDDLLQVERVVDCSNKLYRTMPTPLTTPQSPKSFPESPVVSAENGSYNEAEVQLESLLCRSMSGPDCLERFRLDLHQADEGTTQHDSGSKDLHQEEETTRKDSDSKDFHQDEEETTRNVKDLHQDEEGTTRKAGSTAIKRRPGRRRSHAVKLKRRCSINGHFYNRETSFFTPPHGSQTSVWVTSLVSTQEVINLMLEKYKVDSKPNNFAMFVVRDNGEQRRLRDEEYPLLVRVLLGPHEDVARLFIMDRHSTPEVSNEVAQFLNLSLVECKAILDQYRVEEEREMLRIQDKYDEMKKRIRQRMEELKVRL